MFKELEDLFQSSTIRPTFDIVHIILALFIFGEKCEGIGRYRLQNELVIGSGTAKSLITKLKEKSKFIETLSDSNKRRGHILTEKGRRFLNTIKKKITIIEEGKASVLKDIIIESQNNYLYFCLIKNASNDLSNGIDQRDAAIKIGGIGATCLIYNGQDLIFPSISADPHKSVEPSILNYFNTQLSANDLDLEKNDVIIIGVGENSQKSRLATLNAALTLVKN
jgi:predicted transcriptional regulator